MRTIPSDETSRRGDVKWSSTHTSTRLLFFRITAANCTSLNSRRSRSVSYQSPALNNWITTFGPTFMVRGPFGVHHRLFTLDPRALSHVLGQTSVYTKTDLLRTLIRRWMKEGLITAEGERHRLQRKVAQRLFSRSGLKGMGGVVQDKANQVGAVK